MNSLVSQERLANQPRRPVRDASECDGGPSSRGVATSQARPSSDALACSAGSGVASACDAHTFWTTTPCA